MKKSVKVTGSFLLTSLMFLSSCAGDKIYSQMTDDQSSTPSEKVEASTYNKLLAPTNISFDSETLTLKWDSVLGAASYDVNVNGKIVKSKITANKLELSDKVIDKDKESQFLISVRAANEDETIKSNYTSFLYDISNASSSSNFTFTLSEDKESYSVNGLSPLVVSSFNEELIINREFNGLPVTSIADNAFKGQKKFDKVILPDTITHIGNGAFQNSYIKEIVFSNNLEVIGDYAFDNTIKMDTTGFSKEYSIPASVKSIGNYAFQGTSATKITFAENCQLEHIGDGAFKSISKVNTFTIPSSVKTLGKETFKGAKIKKIILPADTLLTELPESCFSNLKGLSSKDPFVIPSSITSIGDSCFNGSTSISKVYIPEDSNLKVIGNAAFEGSKLSFFGLEYLTENYSSKDVVICIPSTIEQIGDSCFSDIQANVIKFADDGKLTSIGDNAFEKNSVITSIDLPKSLLRIGANAFANCKELETINLTSDSNIEYIDSTAFTKTKFIDSVKGQRVILGNVFFQASSDDLKEKSFTFDSSIKGISNGAFKKSKLTSVSFPEGLKYIGPNAFEGSSDIESLTIPSTVVEIGASAFSGCKDVASLTFTNPYENNLVVIGNSAFANIEKVESIVLPDSVETIGEKAFAVSSDYSSKKGVTGDSKLVKFEISSSSALKEIGKEAFAGHLLLANINIPNGVKSIGSSAFSNCASLSDVYIDIENSSLEVINKNAFENSGLKNINIPSSILNIEGNAFVNCASLTNINYSATAFANSEEKVVKTNTFKGCSSLVEITLPDAISSIQADAFIDCTSLETINCMARDLDKDAFRNTAFENSFSDGIIVYNNILLKYSGNNKNLVIPEGVIDVSANALQNSNIVSVSIPSSLKSIEESAFEGCKNLKSFECDENSSLSVIMKNAFKDCSSLESVSLSKGLTTIESYAFYGCINLKEIDLSSDYLTEVSEYAFANCNSLSNVTFGHSISVVKDYAFYQTSLSSVKFSKSITTIGDYAFANIGIADNKLELFNNWTITPTLSVIEFSSDANLTHIGKYAFANNIVKSVDLPDTNSLYLDEFCFANSKDLTVFKVNVGTTITQGVISGASKLHTLEIPSEISVTSMFGGYVSMVPSTLKTINIADGSTSVKNSAFAGLGMVETINLPSSVTAIGDYSFYGCRSLTSINLEGIVTVGNNAFNGCSRLLDIKFSNKMEYIGDKAFFATLYLNTLDTQEFVVIDGILIQYNGNAKNVVLNDNIVAIAGGAFSGNHDIESIVLGENTNLICNGAFDSCNNLKDIEIKYDGLVNIELQTFDTLSSSLKIKVGSSYLNQYKEDIYWSLYEDLLTTK